MKMLLKSIISVVLMTFPCSTCATMRKLMSTSPLARSKGLNAPIDRRDTGSRLESIVIEVHKLSTEFILHELRARIPGFEQGQ